MATPIVNVSAGTLDRAELGHLERACVRAAQKGTLIVAAGHNRDIVSYPASFPCALGVRAHKESRIAHGYLANLGTLDWVDVEVAPASIRGAAPSDLPPGPPNSFAAPWVSGYLAACLESHVHLSLIQLRQRFCEGAEHVNHDSKGGACPVGDLTHAAVITDAPDSTSLPTAYRDAADRVLDLGRGLSAGCRHQSAEHLVEELCSGYDTVIVSLSNSTLSASISEVLSTNTPRGDGTRGFPERTDHTTPCYSRWPTRVWCPGENAECPRQSRGREGASTGPPIVLISVPQTRRAWDVVSDTCIEFGRLGYTPLSVGTDRWAPLRNAYRVQRADDLARIRSAVDPDVILATAVDEPGGPVCSWLRMEVDAVCHVGDSNHVIVELMQHNELGTQAKLAAKGTDELPRVICMALCDLLR